VPSERKLDVTAIKNLVIAGWTGRNVAALEAHIKELEAIGVKRPKTVPIFYRVASSLLSTATFIEVMADKSSGEVEFVLFALDDGLWLGLGSDHTDRKVEGYSVTVSKQMCDKPVAPVFWAYDSVAPHWDRLITRSYILENGKSVLYQEGPVSGMLAPQDLLRRYDGAGRLADGTLMFGGTHAVRGGIRPSERFEFEIEDPVLGRKIRHGYAIQTLPVLG